MFSHQVRRTRRPLPVAVLLTGLLLVLTMLPGLPGLTTAAAAADSPGGSLVSERPRAGTPHVLDNRVLSVVQVGGSMVLGGTFSEARDNGSDVVLDRSRLLAFDATTGVISTSFVPQPDGQVQVVLPAGDGTSVYVGGKFNNIGGVKRDSLARVRISDGAVLPFNAGAIGGKVMDLRLVNGRLWVAGAFAKIQGESQAGLATVDPTTGALTPYMGLEIAGTHAGGRLNVMKMDDTPDGTRLVVLGNFDRVGPNGNHQLAVLDISGSSAALSGFRTSFYEEPCNTQVFNSYLRDVAVSPDGSYFVVATSGGYGGAESACDSSARFETFASGPNLQPSWKALTGGDTNYAVEVGASAVYVGGHARWQNNNLGNDRAKAGAVARPGIAALDPTNGLPLSWNPTRTRGVGVFDFALTADGLWVGSDTDRIGASYYRARIALLPAAGGASYPARKQPTLPDDVYLLGNTSWFLSSTVDRRSLSADDTVGPNASLATGGIDWTKVTGAFMLNGWLYAGWTNGDFTRQRYDGTTFGAKVAVDTADEIVELTPWHQDVKDMTGLFYDDGRIYFSKSGSSNLFYRYFSPESDVVGNRRDSNTFAVNGFDPRFVRGMFLADDRLYWSTPGGILRRIAWEDGPRFGLPVPGSDADVSGPDIDGLSWEAKALVAYQDSTGSSDVQTDPGAETGTVSHVSAVGSTDNGRQHQVTIPASTQAGDTMVLFSTVNDTAGSLSGPSGWDVIGSDDARKFRTRAWTRTATAADAGSTVTVATGNWLKSDLSLGVYRGTDGSEVAATALEVSTTSSTSHTSPLISSPTAGAWLVTYFGEKSSGATTWTKPAGPVERRQDTLSGGGSISALLLDSGGPVGVGSRGGLTATTSNSSQRVAAYSVVVSPR